MTGKKGSKTGPGFLEKTIRGISQVIDYAEVSEVHSGSRGLLQGLDPRVKMFGLLSWLLAAICSGRSTVTFAILAAGVLLAVLSRIPIRRIFFHAWLPSLLFTGIMALPALFLTPGDSLFEIGGLHFSAQGCATVLRLVARTVTAVTLCMLLVSTTSWPRILAALRYFHIPAEIVVMLGMAQRYIHLLLRLARDQFEARRCRVIGRLSGRDNRRLAGASAGVLLHHSLDLSGEVFLAMKARGFCGRVYTVDEFRMRRRDWIAASIFALIAGLSFYGGWS